MSCRRAYRPRRAAVASTEALAHLPAAFSSVSLLLQPAVAAILAWVILGEALGPYQGLGAMMILVGIYFARRGTASASPPAAEGDP